jgi:hypothetical protein
VSEKQDKFEAWGLLELFGHQRLAGLLTEQTIGGCHFIRIDVPEIDGVQGYTRFFTNGAIYGMTITTEEVARGLAANLRARPVHAYNCPDWLRMRWRRKTTRCRIDA